MPVDRSFLEGASKGNPNLKSLLQQVLQWQDSLSNTLGFDPLPSIGSQITKNPPPQIQALSVTVLQEHFVVQITPASGVLGQVIYKIQSSQTLPFESSTTVITHQESPQASLLVALPDETRYWRVFSKFTGSVYGSPFLVGPFTTTH